MTTTMQATWQGQVVAESDHTVVVEGNHYFPATAVAPGLLTATDTQTVCPWKGTASYYDLTVNGQTNRDAAWFYREPKPDAEMVRDRVAFWRGVVVAPRPE